MVQMICCIQYSTNDVYEVLCTYNDNTSFIWSNLAKQSFILMFWRYILTFNAKNKLKKNITKLAGTIALTKIYNIILMRENSHFICI
jgi:hypothetical protein